MLIASKYEEVWAPEVRDFVYISDRAYTRDQILNMEKIMLNVLRFNLTVPTPYNFLNRFFKAAGAAEDKYVRTCLQLLPGLATFAASAIMLQTALLPLHLILNSRPPSSLQTCLCLLPPAQGRGTLCQLPG
jgi:hypothetical protein